MAVTDLTGTKWVINRSITTAPGGWTLDSAEGHMDTYHISFVSYNYSSTTRNYTTITFRDSDVGNGDIIFDWSEEYPNRADVYFISSGTWEYQAYRLISITGGDDAQNSTLISWLQSNATQVPVVDLTGTTWTIDSIICSAGYGKFYINFDIESESYDEFFIGYVADGMSTQPTPQANSIVISNVGALHLSVSDVISITDGADVSNPDFIVWLTNNATIQESSSPSISIGTLSLASAYCNGNITKIILNGVTLYEKIFYSITVTLTNATASQSNPSVIAEDGTATLVFTFDGTNYICPSTSPVVTGATGVWTKNSDVQGTMVLSNATGNVSFTVAGEQALPLLDTPTNLSVTDTTASFDEVENAEKYEFFVDDVSIGEYSPVTLISFSITLSGNSTTYQAEDGMTWGEWCSSGYNTDGFYVEGFGIYHPDAPAGYEVCLNDSGVTFAELIIADAAYVVMGGGN